MALILGDPWKLSRTTTPFPKLWKVSWMCLPLRSSNMGMLEFSKINCSYTFDHYLFFFAKSKVKEQEVKKPTVFIYNIIWQSPLMKSMLISLSRLLTFWNRKYFSYYSQECQCSKSGWMRWTRKQGSKKNTTKSWQKILRIRKAILHEIIAFEKDL